jgi:hypothetical protein
MDVLEEAIKWLREGGGQVAIHDATNSTEARRYVINGKFSTCPLICCTFVVQSSLRQRYLLSVGVVQRIQSPPPPWQAGRVCAREAGAGCAGHLHRVHMRRPPSVCWQPPPDPPPPSRSAIGAQVLAADHSRQMLLGAAHPCCVNTSPACLLANESSALLGAVTSGWAPAGSGAEPHAQAQVPGLHQC